MGADRKFDLQAAVSRLHSLTIFEIRGEWRRFHRMSPPPRLSRDLIIRGIAYRMQEQVRGGLSKSMSRRLRVLGADNGSIEHRPAAPITLKPGTRLVREWRGDTHSVLVRNDGYEWRGERFTSLSKIAEAITGAHWSGPRFFGLKGQAGGRSDRRPD